MENKLIERNFEELSNLNKEDRSIVMEYFNNWTESYPAYYSDDDTLQDKMEKTFSKWFDENHSMESFTSEDVIETMSDDFQFTASDLEYDVDWVLSYYKGEYNEIFFQELLNEYLEMSDI
jgi:hypothetical protein